MDEADVLVALKVREAYEKILGAKCKCRASYPVNNSKKGQTNLRHYLDIQQKCHSMGVEVSDYFEVMTDPVRAKKPYSQGGDFVRKWKYPYLSFLASERAFELFRYRMGSITRAFMGKKAARSAIKSYSPLNLDNRFFNCFYNGFPILQQLVESGKAITKSRLITAFLAFPETFTPEFIATHSVVTGLEKLALSDNEKHGWKEDLLHALLDSVGGIMGRMKQERPYAAALLKSREKVKEAEKEMSRRIYRTERWDEIWKMLS